MDINIMYKSNNIAKIKKDVKRAVEELLKAIPDESVVGFHDDTNVAVERDDDSCDRLSVEEEKNCLEDRLYRIVNEFNQVDSDDGDNDDSFLCGSESEVERIVRVMKFLKWRWASCDNKTPEVGDVNRSILNLGHYVIDDAVNDKFSSTYYFSSCGGIVVYLIRNCEGHYDLHVMFALTESMLD